MSLKVWHKRQSSKKNVNNKNSIDLGNNLKNK